MIKSKLYKQELSFNVFFIFFGLLLIAHSVQAQGQLSPSGIWTEISTQQISAYKSSNSSVEYWIKPNKFRSFSLDKAALDHVMRQAPLESPDIPVQSRSQPALIYLPTPEGEYIAFEFVESPIMAAALAAKFPEIKTYKGVSVDDPSITMRFDFTPSGFHAQVLAPGTRWYVDPHFKDDTNTYVSYYKKDHQSSSKKPDQCLLEDEHSTLGRSQNLLARSGNTLRTYRLAVATTGEYGQFHGGTTNGALAAVVTTINRVTGIFETEVAVRLTLVGNNSRIIYTNPSTDPFTGNDNASVLINESQAVIDNRIGSANYDIGHTFGTENSSGLARVRSVCNNSVKAQGVTGRRSPTGDSFDVDFVAHEIGHQFGANHTWNGTGCFGSATGGSAYEPGSGSTILGYAGICGADNLQSSGDPIFHSESHAEITAFISGSGACSTNTSLSNSIPTVNAGANYTIPVRTPFMLTGSASDANSGNSLTYLWEQRDLGSEAPLNAADDGQIPLFRVYTPTSNPVRYLPRLATLASNTTDNAEKIPQVARTMNWRLTVRDNRGGVNSDDTRVTVAANAGPFRITSPNGGENVTGAVNVTWNVANTKVAPVSTSKVDIFLSTDGGQTFDMANALASGTANDGFHSVILPNINSSQSRIMVKGSNNIFFDISNQNFNTTSGPVPKLTNPVPGSTLSGNRQTFNWSANGAAVQQWWLYVGSTQGASDLHDSGILNGNLSKTVNGLPTDGSTVFVRLFYRANSSVGWQSIDEQYSTSQIRPVITGPAAGSTLSGNSQRFNWSANGAAVQEWWLYVGSSLGANDLHDSNSLAGSLSTTVNGLPTDGSSIFVRLFYRVNASASWQSIDVQYRSVLRQPSMTSPVAGSTLSASSQRFNWSANGAVVQEWWLYVGSTQGAHNLHDSRSLGNSLSTTVNGLPTDGSSIFVRLFYRANTSANWQSIDLQYSTVSNQPLITSPTVGSTLTGSRQTFNWSANGSTVQEWWLYVGTSQGANDLHNSGSLGGSLSTTVNGLPTNGNNLYVRLFYRPNSNARWDFIDVQYKESLAANIEPKMTNPTAGSSLAGSSQIFTWSANGITVQEWWLYVGTTQGGFDIHNSGSLGGSLSTTVNSLPTDGSSIFVRLFYRTNASWQSIDLQYIANSTNPMITNPLAGSTLGGSSQNFTWTANGLAVQEWWFNIGTTVGASDIYNSGSLGSSLSTTINGLPTDSSTVFVRLWYRTNSGWNSKDDQYTTSSSSGFNVSESQFINNSIAGACAGDVVAVATLGNAANSLTVNLSFNGDLDLGVMEPDGSCLWISNLSSVNGGTHSGDVAAGGAETYSIVNGLAGQYTISAHYHGAPQTANVNIFGSNGSVNLQ